MNDRVKLMLVWPVAGFFAAMAFGVGVIASAAFQADEANGAATGGATQVLSVELGDLFVEPETLTAEPGALTIEVHNGGKTDHNFSLGSLGTTAMLPPGGGETLEIPAVDPGVYAFQCDVPGHADAGMKGLLQVGGAEDGAAPEAPAAGMGHMSPEDMALHDAEVTGSFRLAIVRDRDALCARNLDRDERKPSRSSTMGGIRRLWQADCHAIGPS